MGRKIAAVVVCALAFYAVQWVVAMATGTVIHERILEPAYQANQSFWRPALNQEPPDMAALMPRWITSGLISSLVLSAIYLWIRRAFAGPPWLKGVKYGFVLSLTMCCAMLGWSGLFNLPDVIWFWWGVESFFYFLAGGAALGWVAARMAPEG